MVSLLRVAARRSLIVAVLLAAYIGFRARGRRVRRAQLAVTHPPGPSPSATVSAEETRSSPEIEAPSSGADGPGELAHVIPEPAASVSRFSTGVGMAAVLRPVDPGRPAMAAFGLAAMALGVAGYFHGHLYHEGYGQVAVVGPLFLLNVIGTALVILLLIAGRVLAFVGGVLSIGVGAIVSILISHTSSFFAFAESGYQTTAVIILLTEVVAVALACAGLALGRRRLLLGLSGRHGT